MLNATSGEKSFDVRVHYKTVSSSNCNETFWNGELTVKDNVTGVRRVTGDASVRETRLERSLEIGTIRSIRVGIEADCCRKGVTVR